MAVRLDCTCELWGEKFSPQLAAQVTHLVFAQQHEVGAIGNIGRYRGTKIPYGSASVRVPKSVERGNELLWLIRRLLPHIETLRDSGATDIYLSVAVHHDGQCNWSLSVQELQALATLGVRLDLSVHGLDEGETID